jgi:adenosine kinase
MLQNSREFAEAGIPFIFDPGQAMPLYNGKELTQMIEQATYVTVNDYESSLLQDKTGLSEKQIAERVQAYLITRGPKGSEVHSKAGILQIPAATAMRVVDPTGCGDAYRAGLIYGWMQGMDMATTGRIASLMGALKIEHLGPQNQRFGFEQFAEQFRQQFGYALR